MATVSPGEISAAASSALRIRSRKAGKRMRSFMDVHLVCQHRRCRQRARGPGLQRYISAASATSTPRALDFPGRCKLARQPREKAMLPASGLAATTSTETNHAMQRFVRLLCLSCLAAPAPADPPARCAGELAEAGSPSDPCPRGARQLWKPELRPDPEPRPEDRAARAAARAEAARAAEEARRAAREQAEAEARER